MEKITINIQDIISNPNYSPDEYINELKSKHPEYSLEDLEELAVALIKQAYEYHANTRMIFSERTDEILERIKCGHILTKFEEFEFICDDPIKIEQYRIMESIKDRINESATVSTADFNTLVNLVGFDKETSDALRKEFTAKGILVDEYDDKNTKIQK